MEPSLDERPGRRPLAARRTDRTESTVARGQAFGRFHTWERRAAVRASESECPWDVNSRKERPQVNEGWSCQSSPAL
jgi:hypothetical protein